MDEILKKLDTLLLEMNVPVREYFLPPIGNAELDQFVESIWGQQLTLPKELYNLYQWHSGTDTSAYLQGNIAMCFFSYELAFDNIEGIKECISETSYYPFLAKKMLPLFTSFYGEYLALDLGGTHSLIYCSTSDIEIDDMVTMYDSLTTMFNTINEFYVHHCLEIDKEFGNITLATGRYETYMQIGEKNNPRSDYWRVKREFQEE